MARCPFRYCPPEQADDCPRCEEVAERRADPYEWPEASGQQILDAADREARW